MNLSVEQDATPWELPKITKGLLLFFHLLYNPFRLIEKERENMSDKVDKINACPKCGEKRIDYLVWVDDVIVKCSICKKTYEPRVYAKKEVK